MTLNEARDIIVALDPTRTVYVSADAVHYQHYAVDSPRRRQTTFRVTLFATNGGDLQESWNDCCLENLVDTVCAWLRRGGTSAADESVEATPEPVAV